MTSGEKFVVKELLVDSGFAGALYSDLVRKDCKAVPVHLPTCRSHQNSQLLVRQQAVIDGWLPRSQVAVQCIGEG